MPITLKNSTIEGLAPSGLENAVVTKNTLSDDAIDGRSLYKREQSGGDDDVAIRLSPTGATLGTRNPDYTPTGAIKITMPEFQSRAMFRFRICVYEYSTPNPFVVEVGMYDYIDERIINEFAHYWGGTGRDGVTVRIGNDGSNNVVWLGETNTTWRYPAVAVTEWVGGYSGGDNSSWRDVDWSIDIVTSFDDVRTTYSPVGGRATLSDRRFKTDLIKISDALEICDSIPIYEYNKTLEGQKTKREIGIIAQDLQQVLPEAVIDDGYNLSINYGELAGILTESIKDLQSKNANLQTRANSLINKIESK